MNSTQFWFLMIFSTIMSICMINEIFLSRAIIHQQHLLVDARKIADTDATYENAWKQLALKVYKGSLHDPAMIELLKSENISVREGEPPPPPDATARPADFSPKSPPLSTVAPENR